MRGGKKEGRGESRHIIVKFAYSVTLTKWTGSGEELEKCKVKQRVVCLFKKFLQTFIFARIQL